MDPAVESALIAAAATLVGVGGTVIVAITAARNARRTNQATLDAAHADTQLALDAAREAQFADRYSRALEQVGSANLDVRVGGIYALEGITADSPRHYPTVMDVLTAFIREHSDEQWPVDSKKGRWTRPDVQAALTVVGRRDAKRDTGRIGIDLFAVKLIQTNLNGADLSGAQLDHAHLDRAGLRGADLSGARLNSATIEGAFLGGANLRGATLTKAILTKADLKNATLIDADLTDATFTNTDLTGADLTGAKWPSRVPVPEGWTLDPRAGRLERVSTSSGPAEVD